jgi:hypothetical protein
VLATPDDLRVRIGDVTGDGHNDLVSLGWDTNTVTVHHRQPGGGFGTPEVHTALHSGYDDLELGDVTGDGRTDVVVMSGQTYATPNLSVLRQRADGTLAPAVAYNLPTANTLTNGIGIGDVTGDGHADVVATYGGNKPSSGIAVFASDGDQLASPTTMPSYDIPQPVVVADVDATAVTTSSSCTEAGTAPGCTARPRTATSHRRSCSRSRTRATTRRMGSRLATSPATDDPTW